MSKEIDIEYYHQLALQKQKEHRKVLANLKKKPPKNLDKIAQQKLLGESAGLSYLLRLIVPPALIVARHWGLTLRKPILPVLLSTLR